MILGLSVAAITLSSAVASAQQKVKFTAADLGCNAGTKVIAKEPKSMDLDAPMWVTGTCNPGFGRCVRGAEVHVTKGGKRKYAHECEPLPQK